MLDVLIIKDVILHRYNIKAEEVRQLSGYNTKNYWIKDAKSGTEFVLKLSTQSGFPEESFAEINRTKEYLYMKGFNVPYVVKNKDGQKTFSVDAGNGTNEKVHFELSRFICGKSIQESNLSSLEMEKISSDVGCLGGLLAKELLLQELPRPQYTDYRVTSQNVWYTENFYELKKYVSFVKDTELRRIVEEVLENFKELVHPLLPSLRKCNVHGDFSNTNILILPRVNLDDNIPLNKRYGIIDFEDSHYGAVVFDLCACVAYMLISSADPQLNALNIVGKIVAGFQSCLPLTEAEKSVLYIGILARMATSYVMSLYEISMQPENEQYLSIQAAKFPELLKLFWNKGEQATMEEWLHTVYKQKN